MTVDSRQPTVGWLPALAVVVVVLLTSSDALACSVCFDSKEERRFAFLFTTILLTLLPLGIVGGAVFFLRKLIAKEHAPPPAE